jgi:hypothetical protein
VATDDAGDDISRRVCRACFFLRFFFCDVTAQLGCPQQVMVVV